MHELKITPAAVADLTVINRLAYQIWPEAYGSILSNEQIAFMLQEMYNPKRLQQEQQNGTCFELAIIDGTAIGFIAYGPPEHGVLKLHKLYLMPENHGRGHGSKLLQHVIAAGQKLGCQAVTLYVNKNNQRAIRSYRRNGFEITESVVTPFGNGFVMDDYLMKHEIKQ